MTRDKRGKTPRKKSGRGNGEPQKGAAPSAAARRKQIIIGIVMGIVVGVVISALTQFWYWLPAGIALGLASGAIIKPPEE